MMNFVTCDRFEILAKPATWWVWRGVFSLSCGDDKNSTCGLAEQRGETRGNELHCFLLEILESFCAQLKISNGKTCYSNF